MIENMLKVAVCQIKCGDDTGTGWLIASDTVITAKHCVTDAIGAGRSVELTFLQSNLSIQQIGTVRAFDDDLDVAIIALSQTVETKSLEILNNAPREGSTWISFGFPNQKAQLGHRISGTISQTFSAPRLRMDMDLAVEQSTSLSAYSGLSGSPVMVDGKCIGLLRLKTDRTLGAISINAMAAFLTQHSIRVPDETPAEEIQVPELSLAERTAFQSEFEVFLKNNGGSYLFLEGAHGIGKSTFCNQFKSIDQDLSVLGTYNLTSQGRGAGPAVRVQPDVFFDWLLTSISTQISGKADRKTNLRYSEMAEGAARLLDTFGSDCTSRSSHGVIFIDGINEGFAVDPSTFSKLVGLLPLTIPKNISIVLTAPNFHSVSNAIGTHVAQKNVVSLPRLSDEACLAFCAQQLNENDSPSLLARVCEKAQGHPLYLRYLIEYVNDTQDFLLKDFPTLSGSIEQYYESIWTRLLHDAEAVQLLATMARLRWGILVDFALRMLPATEQAVFIPTLSRIQHLLSEKESTEIYHNSFIEFICEKTAGLNQFVHNRIAEFCTTSPESDYCKLNVIYHLLKSGDDSRRQAISCCQQRWIDDCVMVGVEPDLLLADIEETLSAAIGLAQGTEVVRLLLLQQRVTFRYNVLFAQSAYLIANALISIGRTGEALKTAVRYNTLIVDSEDALKIAYSLIDHDQGEKAISILRLVHGNLIEAYSSSSGRSVDEFVVIAQLLIQVHLYAGIADGHPRVEAVTGIARRTYRLLKENLENSNRKLMESCFARIQSVVAGFLLWHGKYASLAQIQAFSPGAPLPPTHYLTLLSGLFNYSQLLAEMGDPSEPAALSVVFSDLFELIQAEPSLHDRVTPIAADVLVELGAPANLVELLKEKTDKFDLGPILVVKENGVDVDFDALIKGLAERRIEAFLTVDSDCPSIESIDLINWRNVLEQLLGAVAWCEGKAYRAKTEGDTSASTSILEFIQSSVLPVANFTLSQRYQWQRSYAIPEAILPIVWERLTTLMRDCYPGELQKFLQDLAQSSSGQFGLFTEGFRDCLERVVSCCMPAVTEPRLDDAVLSLLEVWEEHLVTCVENRHELVPELMKLIPLFSKLGALERAEGLYRRILAVSMGPSWYKEDQFGLIATTLRQLPATDTLQNELSTIAGNLQRASGEMTFQRYIRYEKSHLIGELFRRRLFSQGFRYFQRQSCGNLAELVDDVRSGKVDRISATIGMRHPGGSLDEQEAILDIVRNSKGIDWKLRWALLEIFQCGDNRHIANYAREFAALINESSDARTDDEMFIRLNAVIGAELSEGTRSEFFSSFRQELAERHHQEADTISRKHPGTTAAWDPRASIRKSDKSASSTHQENIDEEDNEIEDKLFMPGTFGRSSSLTLAAERIKIAERQIRLKNIESGKSEAVQALKILQDGGWPIWGNLSSSSKRAEEILLQPDSDANDTVRWYAELIEGERFATKWQVAYHLIGLVGNRFDESDRRTLLTHVVEHIGLMVGECDAEISMFSYLDSRIEAPPLEAYFGFVVWLLNHPSWLRRSNASRLMVWLVTHDDTYFTECAKVAFESDVSPIADIACGALDALSSRHSGTTWNRLNSAVNLRAIAESCTDIGRSAALLRISERAEKSGSADAKEIATLVKDSCHTAVTIGSTNTIPPRPPYWTKCMSGELMAIHRLGLMTPDLLNGLEREMAVACTPLSIGEVQEIEAAVVTSFRERPNHPLNRFDEKVRFSLRRALSQNVTFDNLELLDSIIRRYNPNAPEDTMVAGFSSPGKATVEAIGTKKELYRLLGFEGAYFLNYFEKIMVVDGNTGRKKGNLIEIFAVLVPAPHLRNATIGAAMSATFGSRHFPEQEQSDIVGPTCIRIEPDFAHFGSFTPAIPTSSFMALTHIRASDCSRKSWRNGRSYDVLSIGKAESEGCMLSIPRDALQLDNGMEMYWVVKLNDKFFGVIDQQGRKVN